LGLYKQRDVSPNERACRRKEVVGMAAIVNS